MKDDWAEKFPGRCDICRKPKKLAEVHPGFQAGWRVGYVCGKCSDHYKKNPPKPFKE